MLDREGLEYCRRHGIPLAYDCAQIGWVTQACTDDEATEADSRVALAEGRRTRVDSEEATAGLLRSFKRDVRRSLATASGDRPTPSMSERNLRSAASAAVERLAEAYDLQTAVLARWALLAVLAREVGATRGPIFGVPGESDSGAFSFRAWREDDTRDYLRLMGNPKVWKYLPEPYPSPFDEETARRLIEVASFDFHHEARAVEVDGRPIGQCLLRLDRRFAGAQAAEVAYWLGEEHWGKGWMSRILPVFTYQSFARHPVDVLYAWILPDNVASIRLVERVGYRRDPSPFDSQIAESLRRPGFVRYATYRGEWLDEANST